jgi:hypothetical protein
MKCIDNAFKHVVTKLFSNDPSAKVSVYMHLKLTDPGPKGHPNFNYEYPPVNKESMLNKIQELTNTYPDIKIHHTLLDGEEISEHDLLSQLKARSRFTEHLGEDKFLKRSMFIHYNYEKCGVNILRLQEENKCVYDTFVYMRPDIIVSEDCNTIDTYDKDKVIFSSRRHEPDKDCLGGTGLIFIIPKKFFKNFFVDIMNIYRTDTGDRYKKLISAEEVGASALPYKVAKISNPEILRN